MEVGKHVSKNGMRGPHQGDSRERHPFIFISLATLPLTHFRYPNAPCKEYLPTFTPKLAQM